MAAMYTTSNASAADSDGWSRTYTHTTNADPARLWELLADVDGWGAWNDGIETIRLLGPCQIGTTFEMTVPGGDQILSTIVALDPPLMITDSTEFEGALIVVEHRLRPAEDGATEISYTVRVEGALPDDVAAEVGTGVSADFPVVMAGLAAAAVSSGSRPLRS